MNLLLGSNGLTGMMELLTLSGCRGGVQSLMRQKVSPNRPMCPLLELARKNSVKVATCQGLDKAVSFFDNIHAI